MFEMFLDLFLAHSLSFLVFSLLVLQHIFNLCEARRTANGCVRYINSLLLYFPVFV